VSLRSVLALVLAAALAGGCGAADDWSAPHAKPTAVGALGNGFVDPSSPPAPEATITPRPGSWNAVHPSAGYRVVLLTTGENAPTRTLEGAVTRWAKEEDVSLKTVNASNPRDYITPIVRAMRLKPDLVVAAGNGLIDPLALVSANHLDQQFLVLGAELAEPTYNVTAANWVGAAVRGEGLGKRDSYDPASFTPERAGEALRAGVAAVLHGLTGIVVRLA